MGFQQVTWLAGSLSPSPQWAHPKHDHRQTGLDRSSLGLQGWGPCCPRLPSSPDGMFLAPSSVPLLGWTDRQTTGAQPGVETADHTHDARTGAGSREVNPPEGHIMYLVYLPKQTRGQGDRDRHRDQNRTRQSVPPLKQHPVRSRLSPPPRVEFGAIQLEAVDHQTRPGRPCGFFSQLAWLSKIARPPGLGPTGLHWACWPCPALGYFLA